MYRLNFNLGESRVTKNRLILMLRNLFDEVIEEIWHHAPLNSWVIVFFNHFPTREFGTSTVCVGDIDNSMFMNTLSCNMQSNDTIEVNCEWECNVVISYTLHGSGHDGASACGGLTQRNAWRVQLQNVVSGHGRCLMKRGFCNTHLIYSYSDDVVRHNETVLLINLFLLQIMAFLHVLCWALIFVLKLRY